VLTGRCFLRLACLQPFYGQEIRLVVCGYVRPEANFTSLEALITRIHKDAEVSKAALSHKHLAQHAEDSFLSPISSSAIGREHGEGVVTAAAVVKEPGTVKEGIAAAAAVSYL
jgi:riboflavin kinase